MLGYIKRKIEKIKSKRSLQQYGCDIRQFDVPPFGTIGFAQWLHPYTTVTPITPGLVAFFGQYINPGDFAIDIGAHCGDTTVPMALCAGAQGTVLGLEPNPHVFKVLVENSSMNKAITNLVPLNFAATDADGIFTFNYSDASFGNGGFFDKIKNQKHGHKYRLDVQGRNLEQYLDTHYADQLSRLSFIKVDAEGYDKEILKSISNVLRQYHPVVVSECNVNLVPEERFELYEVLHHLGYRLKRIPGFDAPDDGTPITRKEDMLRWKHFDFVAVAE